MYSVSVSASHTLSRSNRVGPAGPFPDALSGSAPQPAWNTVSPKQNIPKHTLRTPPMDSPWPRKESTRVRILRLLRLHDDRLQRLRHAAREDVGVRARADALRRGRPEDPPAALRQRARRYCHAPDRDDSHTESRGQSF